MFKRKGGGFKGLLNDVQKNCTFLNGWLPLMLTLFYSLQLVGSLRAPSVLIRIQILINRDDCDHENKNRRDDNDEDPSPGLRKRPT